MAYNATAGASAPAIQHTVMLSFAPNFEVTAPFPQHIEMPPPAPGTTPEVAAPIPQQTEMPPPAPGTSPEVTDPADPGAPLLYLDYSGLKVEDATKLRRFVSRQTHFMPVLLRTLKKTVLRRFLRTNNKRYRSRDRKDFLVGLVVAMVRERGTAEAPVDELPKKPRRLLLGQHYPGMRCQCPISYEQLVQGVRPVVLDEGFKKQLKFLVEKGTVTQLERELQLYRQQADVCRVQNLMAIRDIFEYNLVQQKALVTTSFAAVDRVAENGLMECSVCLLNEVCVVLKPCGHYGACLGCISKLDIKRCPFCRAEIVDTKIVNMRLCQ